MGIFLGWLNSYKFFYSGELNVGYLCQAWMKIFLEADPWCENGIEKYVLSFFASLHNMRLNWCPLNLYLCMI